MAQEDNETRWRQAATRHQDQGSRDMRAYATGAFVSPLLVNGQWRWVVDNFNEDVFYDGRTLNVNDSAATLAGLITADDDGDSEIPPQG